MLSFDIQISFHYLLSRIIKLPPPKYPQIDVLKSWLLGTDELKGIKVVKNNPNIIYYQSKFRLGKSDPKNDNFDVLLLAFPDFKDGLIPSFVKEISSYCFEKC